MATVSRDLAHMLYAYLDGESDRHEDQDFRSWWNFDTVQNLIEQALLAERRLAMEEAAKIADTVEIHYSGKGHITLPASTVRSNIAALLRSAAEKEVGK